MDQWVFFVGFAYKKHPSDLGGAATHPTLQGAMKG